MSKPGSFQQLSINFPQPAWTSLGNLAGDKIRFAMQSVEDLIAGNEPYVYLVAPAGFGKTHLLYAACQSAAERGLQCAYIDMQLLQSMPTEVLMGYENIDILCIDNIDVVAQHSEWEQALFRIYNASKLSGQKILLAAKEHGDWGLKDWASRVSAFAQVQIDYADEADLKSIAQAFASWHAIELADAVVQFIISRIERSPGALVSLLEEVLEQATREKKRITIPFLTAYFSAHD